jgi:hypothetical protein
MDTDDIYAVLPFVVIAVLGSGLWVVFRQRAAARRASSASIVEPDLATPVRDAPHPRRRWRRGPRMDPRTNGHAKRDPGA